MKEEMDVVGTASNAEDALKQVERTNPDVVLMDIEMKGIDGIQTTSVIKERWPNIEVIVLTMHTDEQYLLEAIEAGAKGYVLKDFPSSFLLEAIRAVAEGESLFDPASSNKILKQFRHLLSKEGQVKEEECALSKKEREILGLIAQGYRNKEIAQRLCLSEHTVRNYIANIFVTLRCSTRTGAVLEATKKGII
jgi:two-component system response regulator NreC